MIGAQLTDFARLMDGDRPDVRAMEGEEIARWLGPTFDLYLGGQ